MRCMIIPNVVAVCMTCIASATTLLVPSEYTTIQSGIDAAIDGDTVLVSAGIYNETIDFSGKLITVLSVAGADTTVIKGSPTSGSVVTFTSGETNFSILDGFWVRNGSSANGGGVFIQGSSPLIRNCKITGNTATFFGGGIFVDSSDITLENIIIEDNVTGDAGGGIYMKFSSGRMTGSSLINNSASNGGGIYAKSGKAIFTISSATVQGNVAENGGGGVFATNGRVNFDSSDFSFNTASQGGAWFSWSSGNGTFVDCTFTSNSATDVGGAANIRSSIATFTRPTFDSNQSDSDCDGGGSGGAIDIVNSNVTIEDPTLCTNKNCDVFSDFSGDPPSLIGAITTCASLGACCGGEACWEMLEIECINGGGIWNGDETACAVVPCVGGVDIGACCIDSLCIMAADAACTSAGGVFEGIGVSCSTVECPVSGCPTDLNHDGFVSVGDLLMIIDAWGACP